MHKECCQKTQAKQKRLCFDIMSIDIFECKIKQNMPPLGCS